MKLFLLRHGKAVQGVENQTDFDRDLSDKGFKQSRKIGQFLINKGIDRIISSSAKRTVSTAETVNSFLNIKDLKLESELYLADYEFLFHYLSNLVSGDTILLVGHNFGISQLVDYYTGYTVALGTGHLAIIDFDVTSLSHFSKHSGRLIEIVSPKQL